jgi:spermidine synthase
MVPTRRTYAGLFVLALASITHQILLTRIFSVTSWYHFAFVAVSIAMFGMTVGAVIVFVLPRLFPPGGVSRQVAVVATAYPVLLVLTFLTQLSVPFIVHLSVVGVYSITFVYAVVALPFVASGVCICLILTRYPGHVSQLYAADLAGAALGCILLVFLLPLTDGPTAVIGVAWMASLGAVLFAGDVDSERLRRVVSGVALGLGVAFVGHTVMVWNEFPVLRILYTKGGFESRPLYERWNSYSRVQVSGDPDQLQAPYARTLSPVFPPERRVRELRVDIDVSASTSLLAYSGDLGAVDFLKYDVTNIGHYLRPGGDTLVVGTGGGRDVLAALAFGARSVTGVEINRQILETVNRRFGDFSGHLDRDPRVRFVNDEARSYLARSRDRYDFLQISLIDTWAATAAGAFVLSENSIYTVEAWRIFLDRLTDGGVLSVSRWYSETEPAEIYRLVSLAVASLNAAGVERPRGHLVLIRSTPKAGIGVGTLLVSRTPWDAADVERLAQRTGALQFETMLSPRQVADETIAQLTSGQNLAQFLAGYQVNISAPTDDSPFFFQMLRLRDMFKPHLLRADKSTSNMQAVVVLGALLLTVLGLSALCIVVPLALSSEGRAAAGSAPLVLFFSAIGLGFMVIETSLMQRLIVVLGHPTYGLSVVLFTLLLSSGLGSYLTRGVASPALARTGVRRLGFLLVVLLATGIGLPVVARSTEAATTAVRIVTSIAMLFPAGVLMGMAFPLGMKVAAARAPQLAPWLWGINGAFSVCATVLAIAVALTTTISMAFWLGCASYLVALVAFARAARPA